MSTHHYGDKSNWGSIERGYVFDAVTFYQSDGKQPLTFFVPDEPNSNTGKLVDHFEEFKPKKIDGRPVAVEHQAVVRLKPRKVVVLSHNILNQSTAYEFVHVAPIHTLTATDKFKPWYNSLKEDQHLMFVNYPNPANGYERYIDVSQVTSIHKALLIKKREELSVDRLDQVQDRLLELYDLGVVVEVPKVTGEEASNQ